jgi:hypothetical protein
MRGRRAYFLNRQPYSTHRRYLQQNGFELIHETRYTQPPAAGIKRENLARRFADLSDDDMTTSGVFIQTVKPVMP